MGKINNIGYHDVKAVKAEFGESSKGTPFLFIQFENASGDSIGSYNYLSEKAAEYTDKMLREVFQFDGEYHLEATPSQIVGKAANIKVGMEDDGNGGERVVCQYINAAGGKGGGISLSNSDSFLDGLTKRFGSIPVAESIKLEDNNSPF